MTGVKKIWYAALRKHVYSNMWKILPPKIVNFQIKKSDIFHISAQIIDYRYSLEPPRRGGSNEYPQSMFLSRNKKNNVSPSFTITNKKIRFDTCAILYPCIKHILKQSMKIVTVSVHRKWDRLVIY